MVVWIFLFLFAVTCPSPLPFAAAVAVHEGAHILCAFFLRMGRMRLRQKGAWLQIEYPASDNTIKNILLCLSGPAVGIAAGLIFFKFSAFSFCSLTLGIVNLLPLSCFDGGGILREVCNALFLPDTAWKICRTASVFTVLLLWTLSVAVQFSGASNYSLLFLSTVLVVTILSERE